MRRSEWAIIAVLLIAAVYFLAFHEDPLPLNHEAVGLGEIHLAHDVIGIVLIVLAGLVWWRSRRAARSVPPTTP